MNPIREHFHRTIAGTARVEHRQVIYGPDGEQIERRTFSRAASAVSSTVDYVDGASGLNRRAIIDQERAKLVVAGWVMHFSQEILPAVTGMDGDTVAFDIRATEDLRDVLEAIGNTIFEVDVALEDPSVAFIGGYEVKLQRSRRRAGETRPLRYDTLVTQVPRGSLASHVLAVLAIKHGGRVMGADGTGVCANALASELVLDERFEPILKGYGIALPQPPASLMRRWGRPVIPAVF